MERHSPWAEGVSGCLDIQRIETVNTKSEASPVAEAVRNLPAVQGTQETRVPWVRKIPWRRKWHSIQYSFLENPFDREAWWAIVHGVTTTGHTHTHANTKYSFSLKQTSPWISAAHQGISKCPRCARYPAQVSRDTDGQSLLSCSPLLPEQTLFSLLKIYAPNAYSNIPIDLPLASHYQDLFIPSVPH